jgi:hypothetical protein
MGSRIVITRKETNMRNKLMALAAAAFLCVSATASAMPGQNGGPGNTQHVKPPQPRTQTAGSANGSNPGCGTRGARIVHTQ